MEPIRIEGLDDARRALTAAKAAGARAVLEAEIGGGGPAWLAEIARILKEEFPETLDHMRADCGNSAGLAMAAQRMGLADIRFDGAPEQSAKLEALGLRIAHG
ncbi:MAG: hypothetical protein IBJ15_19065 [Alphaproteobacteria bacterium]|nr:hypothetical protein [Alphaproteobacteria bacterium]